MKNRALKLSYFQHLAFRGNNEMHFEEKIHFHISFLVDLHIFLCFCLKFMIMSLISCKTEKINSFRVFWSMTQFSICSLLKAAMKHRIIEVEQNNYNTPYSFSETVFFSIRGICFYRLTFQTEPGLQCLILIWPVRHSNSVKS